MSVEPRELGKGKYYHALIIYNHARTRLAEVHDTKLSREITEMVDKQLHSWGFNKTYYHERDALPGRNVFTELFRTIKLSEWVIVVFTKGFNSNCWGQYCQMAAFNELIEKHSRPEEPGCTFLPIFIDLKQKEIPNNVCVNHGLSFSTDDWRDMKNQEWEKLKRAVETKGIFITDTQEHSSEQRGSSSETSIQHNPVTNPSDALPKQSFSIQGQSAGPLRPSGTTTPAQNILTDQGNPLALANDAAMQDVSMDAVPGQTRTNGQHSTLGSEDEETNAKQYDSSYSSLQSTVSTPPHMSHLESQDLEEDYRSLPAANRGLVDRSVSDSLSSSIAGSSRTITPSAVQTPSLSSSNSSGTITPSSIQPVAGSRVSSLGNVPQHEQRGPPDGRAALPVVRKSIKVWSTQESDILQSVQVPGNSKGEENELNLDSRVPSLDPNSLEHLGGAVLNYVDQTVPYEQPSLKMEDPRETARLPSESSSGIGHSLITGFIRIAVHLLTSPEKPYM